MHLGIMNSRKKEDAERPLIIFLLRFEFSGVRLYCYRLYIIWQLSDFADSAWQAYLLALVQWSSFFCISIWRFYANPPRKDSYINARLSTVTPNILTRKGKLKIHQKNLLDPARVPTKMQTSSRTLQCSAHRASFPSWVPPS